MSTESRILRSRRSCLAVPGSTHAGTQQIWGVTALEANAEMDAGDISGNHAFATYSLRATDGANAATSPQPACVSRSPKPTRRSSSRLCAR